MMEYSYFEMRDNKAKMVLNKICAWSRLMVACTNWGQAR